jgi:broad specificity phosphatase PhoE
MPAADAAVPARRWHLSPQGRAAARALRLPAGDGTRLVASDEPKAEQTLIEATGHAVVATDPGFGEVRRPAEWTPDHREKAHAYVSGTVHHGWEPHAAVAERFDDAVARHATSGTLIVATHGMAMTVWLASRVAVDAGSFWSRLRFPDIVDVDLAAATATRRPQ